MRNSRKISPEIRDISRSKHLRNTPYVPRNRQFSSKLVILDQVSPRKISENFIGRSKNVLHLEKWAYPLIKNVLYIQNGHF